MAAVAALADGVQAAAGDDDCFSSASVVGAVIGTIVVLLGLEAGVYALWRLYWRSRRGESRAAAKPGSWAAGVLERRSTGSWITPQRPLESRGKQAEPAVTRRRCPPRRHGSSVWTTERAA
ncbi:hypothetical protein ONE63_009037 [Megalurothrips usitatus]|uniref:Uncharacterized protein n=1 Tax=Megalurothrips usitatus TaxID=439358 RepID=A0AAV7XM09_9NEOP|nr:hypothetical protein ONE63_009037 [Megalurothrips usitatus]